ncbi:MAG: hypothetical protein KDH16_10800 [Rhodocyclaceae bacterium]|nr:hypothetical protein [Rhodocyclaceae bacterium]MCP5310764.1 hypothetical protein [Zoogloeaceae bacterium]
MTIRILFVKTADMKYLTNSVSDNFCQSISNRELNNESLLNPAARRFFERKSTRPFRRFRSVSSSCSSPRRITSGGEEL